MTRTPVIILNGFLGSGKTTLFRNLLNQSKKDSISVCAVVNDMSELDVDGELIATTDIVEENSSILESIHSCVLSSKKGIEKLQIALEKLLAIQNPDVIIIETSGSCHPMPLVQFFKTQKKFKLTGLFALMDSLMLGHDYSFGKHLVPQMQFNLEHNKRDMINLLVEQILFCSHLILTKTDRIKEERINDIAQNIQGINPHVPIFAILFGKISIQELLVLPEYNYFRVEQLIKELKPVLESESLGDRPYNMATRVIRDDRPFHPERLWKVCHQYLDKRIYRSKGFFWLCTRKNISLLWNQAAGSINLELIGYWRSGVLEDSENKLLENEIALLEEKLKNETGRFGDRHCDLTVIGDQDHVDRFTAALKSCFLTEQEMFFWNNGGEFKDPWPKNIVKLA